MISALLMIGLAGCQDKTDSSDASDSSENNDGRSEDGDDLPDGGDEDVDCDAALDSDGDGLDDCAEADLGTDPLSEDSDGDGYTDSEEVDCIADPNDAAEACYACGWKRNDPGDISSTGSGLGDVMDNFAMVDQCGELVDMWDFYGEYHVLYMTAAW